MVEERTEGATAGAEAQGEEENVTLEFEIIYESLNDPVEVIETKNPREALSPEELAEHIEGLESVVRARALAAEE